jgi:xanthine dehydrogenase accessory factor
VGCIGSARKALRFRERLAQRGLASGDVERIQMPMGLDIGAQSPEEIAVAVVAELIRARAAAAVRRVGPQAVHS